MDESIQELDDATLVRFVQGRDGDAFRVVYERYRRPLIGCAYRYVRSVAIAEDLVQSVFAKLWCGKTAWEIRTTVQAYLFRAVRHAAGKYCRRADWEVGLEEAGRLARIGVIATDNDARPVGAVQGPEELSTTNAGEAHVLIDELARLFVRVVSELPEPAQSAYRLAREQKMSYEEIADALEMIPNRVRQHIMTAHREIDQRLTQAGWPGLVFGNGILSARTGFPRPGRRKAGGDRDGA